MKDWLSLKIPPLRKFFSSPSKERHILLKAFFLLIIIRLGLWVLPFGTLQKTLERLFHCPVTTNAQTTSPEKIARAVSAVSQYVPSATCLAQALTLQALLSREGIHSELAIGVARDDESGITAHAWLEIDGTVIIGGQERDRYTQLMRQE
jgi:hypothetical protein